MRSGLPMSSVLASVHGETGLRGGLPVLPNGYSSTNVPRLESYHARRLIRQTARDTLRHHKYLRYYLVEVASKVMMHTPKYRRYYQKKYAEAAKHQHKRALVLTARKLVRLVFALLSNGQIYRHQGGR